MPDETEARAQLKQKIDAVRARFLAGFDGRVQELLVLAEAMSSADAAASDAARQALSRGLHTIVGSAPTIGLPELGARARALEAELASAAVGTPLQTSFIKALAQLRNHPRESSQ